MITLRLSALTLLTAVLNTHPETSPISPQIRAKSFKIAAPLLVLYLLGDFAGANHAPVASMLGG